MDKDKLNAARKRLKEYQKSKKEQFQEKHVPHQNTASPQVNTVNQSSANNNDCTKVPSQNENYPQQSMEQQNGNNTLDFSKNFHNKSNLDTKSSQLPNFIDNNAMSMTQCQTNYKQDIFSNELENKYEPSEPMIEVDTSVQKEEMLQSSFVMENALKSQYDNVRTYDECHQQGGLSIDINNDKILIVELQKQISKDKNKIKELEKTLQVRDFEFQERLSQEITPLQEQLQIHARTTSILVAEKAQLNSALNQSQTVIDQKTDEVKDLSNKLKTCCSQVSKLEDELLFVRRNNNDVQQACQQWQTRYDDLTNQISEIRKVKEDLELETSELKQKVTVKNTDIAELEKELQEKVALLSLSDLKIQQLTNFPQETQMVNEDKRHIGAVYEQQITQLKEMVQNLTDEKTDAGKQYKSYVQQLDERHIQLNNELESSKKLIAEFQNREESYIQRLSEMEQQLQKEKEKIESLSSLSSKENYQDRIDMLTKNIDHLVLEQESLQMALNERDAEIEELKHQLQQLYDSNREQVDTSKLVTALESEQLGAARAVSQNQQLKNQLDEMHNAFVTLSNDKLQLTEQLEAERNIGKKLNVMLNDLEAELDELKQQVCEKEAALLECEKVKLCSNQMADQIQHYQAQSQNTSTLQQELSKALNMIEVLRKENESLIEKINIQSKTMVCLEQMESTTSQQLTTEHIPLNNNEADPLLSNESESQIHSIETQTLPEEQAEEEEYKTFNIPEPMKKLEAKFKQTMEQVAELSDEKQRLEHLVMQLQGETDTIGEYIALYQDQRKILYDRAKEKEESYKLLLRQRNHLKEQLHKLKVLVADLIEAKGELLVKSDQTCADNIHETNSEMVEEHTILNEHSDIIDLKPAIKEKSETMLEIMDLLTEIKDCNDICITEPDFHPCPWCSGKLITV